MDNENQNQTLTSLPMLENNFSPAPPPPVTATSITELLNSHVSSQASLNCVSPASSSSTNMTSVSSHLTDVTVPCTSNGGPGPANVRSSPYPEPSKPVTTAANPIGSQFMSNGGNNGRTSANVPMPAPPPYHSQFYQQQQNEATSSGTVMTVRGKTDPAMAPYMCAKCNKKIVDRYLLEALDKYWHEDCLKCHACDGRLGELGSKLYFKNNSILCQRDYLRIFRPTGKCAACSKPIPAFEQVMRAGANVYHLECFACQECNHRFCIGDKFYLDVDHNKILCEYDYEERLVFAQMAYNYNSLAQLKRQISQQVDDFDEVQPVQPR